MLSGEQPSGGFGGSMHRTNLTQPSGWVVTSRPALATLLLAASELLWIGVLGVPVDGARMLSLVSQLAALVLVAFGVGHLLRGLADRLGARPGPWLLALATTPAALWVSNSLFSGRWIATQPGARPMAAALALGLVLGVRLAVSVSDAIARAEAARRPAWGPGLLALVLLAACSAADNLVQVGLYPAFHFSVAVGEVLAACLCARALLSTGGSLPRLPGVRPAPLVTGTRAVTGMPEERPPGRWSRRVALLALLVLALASPVLGAGRAADELVVSTHGLLPKLRRMAVWLDRQLTGTGPERPRSRLAPGPVSRSSSKVSPGLEPATASNPGSNLVPDAPANLAPDQRPDLAQPFVLHPCPLPAAQVVREATRNVIVVILDALRDDHVGPRGGQPSLTPNLDRVAAEGVRFLNVYAPSDHTGRSIPCLLTGLPLEVTLRAADWHLALATWIDVLARAGFASFHNGSEYVAREYDSFGFRPHFGAEQEGSTDAKSDQLAGEILQFARRQGERPFAVYTHWSYAHIGRRKHAAAEYAEQVRRCDRHLGELIDGLAAAGLWDSTLLIVSADHGYALGESFQYQGAHGCAEISLRVPLVMHLPGLSGLPRRPDPPVSNLSLVPTLLDVLAPDSGLLMGAPSLLPLLVDPTDPRLSGTQPVFASTGAANMIRVGHAKLTRNSNYRTAILYDLAVDPGERAPRDDPVREQQLLELLEREQDRQARLAQAMAAVSRNGLDPAVLAAFASAAPPQPVLVALLSRWPGFNARSREFVLAELYRRRLGGCAAALDQLAGALPGVDDELLFVLRLWAGSESAAAGLPARLPELSGKPLLWFASMLPDLPPASVAPVTDVLRERLAELWAERPLARSEAALLVGLLGFGLRFHLPAEQLGPVKDVLVELFNLWSQAPEPGPAFVTLRDRRFHRRMLLDVFYYKPDPSDLSRLQRLSHNLQFAERVVGACRAQGTPRAQAWLLDLLAHWSAPGEDPPGAFLAAVIRSLAKWPDEAFRQEADAVIQERFPYLPHVE